MSHPLSTFETSPHSFDQGKRVDGFYVTKIALLSVSYFL